VSSSRRPSRHRSAGFTLVEIMVGMVIGMFGLIIMMQVFSLSEETKRTTTSGGDASSTGAIALFGLQRDVRQAGYGASDTKILGCNLLLRAGVTLNVMAPVTINHASIPAGDANTDTLLVVYGNANGSTQGDGITSQPATGTYAVQTPTSFVNSDRVIASPPTRASPCNLVLDTVTGVINPNVTVATGVASMTNGTLFNLGQTPRVQVYAVRSGNLTQCDFIANDCSLAGNVANSSVWVPIANNIASMRVEYGRDTTTPTMDGFVDIYDQTAPATACTIARVSALRVVLVARSALYEKTAVTTAAPTWEGGTVQTATAPTNPTSYPIDLTGNGTWQNYRYKVFQTVVPLRNLAWQGVQSGC
jgi:type IV pilus assembly protein PilW